MDSFHVSEDILAIFPSAIWMRKLISMCPVLGYIRNIDDAIYQDNLCHRLGFGFVDLKSKISEYLV